MALPTEVFMPQATPVGYGGLVDRHHLSVVRPHRWTFLAKHGGERVEPDKVALRLPHLEPASMSDVEHLLFALKHERVCLPVLDAYLERADPRTFEGELIACIRAQPTSKYARILWFLYEWLTERALPLPDLETGNYVAILDPAHYFTGPRRRTKRQRVFDNLLGNKDFCPFVRRTDDLAGRSAKDLRSAMTSVATTYDPSVLSRALAYLYTRETMSSFAIERETPSPDRAEKFGRLLRRVTEVRDLDEETLTSLQNAIVDPRFAESGYRRAQNYIGESVSLLRQRIHFVPPRPDAIATLMQGWQRAATELIRDESSVDAVIAAACVAFGFVYLHPFEDGNGRLHRFLVHLVLAQRAVTPSGFIVPVSAVMLSRRAEYDACLDVFSSPLLGKRDPGGGSVVDYDMDNDGSLTVTNDTRRHYRFIDLTEQAQSLYRWLDAAVRDELPAELDFLVGLDQTRTAMRAIVDLPDRMADLFIKLVLQNGGHLSKTKRGAHFHQLTDHEIADLEAIIGEHMPPRSFGLAEGSS